jgi:hypothetical protein
VVVISDHDIGIYLKQENTLNLLKMINGKAHNTYLSVDIADVTGNGVQNIIVTSLNRSYLNSCILEYKNGKYNVIASNIPYFLRAITMPDSSVVLMGQPLSMSGDPFDTPVYEMTWRNGKLRTGKKMMIPEGLSVYSVSIVSLTGSGADKVLALDSGDRICVYEKTDKHLSTVNAFGGSKEALYRSEEVFGGTNNIFDLPDRRSGNSIKDNYYVNLRTFEVDADKEGRRQLIVVKNLSASGRYFKNMTMFTSAEIYNLEWDGMGFVENWRTRKINGYVADYQFKDIDNDGQKELVLALVMSSGGFLQKEGVIVSYKLNQ